MIKVGFTGHRPNKLYGYKRNKQWDNLEDKIEEVLKDIIESTENKSIKGIVGGALGFDTEAWYALDSVKYDYGDDAQIEIEMAIPFEEQDVKWPAESRNIYKECKEHSDYLTYVDILDDYKVPNTAEGKYNPKKLFKRNEYIANNSDILIACVRDMKSGSGHCIDYFKKVNPGKTLIVINPDTLEVTREVV